MKPHPPKPAEEDKNDEEGKEGESPRTREQSIETEQAAPPPPPGPPTNEEQQEQPQAVAKAPHTLGNMLPSVWGALASSTS